MLTRFFTTALSLLAIQILFGQHVVPEDDKVYSALIQSDKLSGVYKDISIAIDSSNHLVTGVYEYYDKWDDHYKEFLDVNVFFFTGAITGGDVVSIRASWPGRKH